MPMAAPPDVSPTEEHLPRAALAEAPPPAEPAEAPPPVGEHLPIPAPPAASPIGEHLPIPAPPAASPIGEHLPTPDASPAPSPPQGSPLKSLGHAPSPGPGEPVVSALHARGSVALSREILLDHGASPSVSLCRSSAIVEQIVALSREMGRQCVYVGQAAFLLLGLQRRLNVGAGSRLNAVEDYMSNKEDEEDGAPNGRSLWPSSSSLF